MQFYNFPTVLMETLNILNGTKQQYSHLNQLCVYWISTNSFYVPVHQAVCLFWHDDNKFGVIADKWPLLHRVVKSNQAQLGKEKRSVFFPGVVWFSRLTAGFVEREIVWDVCIIAL